jgi:hypothetical protein
MKITIDSRGGHFTAEIEGATIQEWWQQAAFIHSLPTTCPVDNTPVRFGYAKHGDDEFYYLESTPKTPEDTVYQFQFGTRQADKKLFPGKVDKDGGKAVQRWTYWDGQQKVVAWEDGKLVGGKPEPVGRYPTQPERKEGVSNGASPIQPDSIEALRIEFELRGNQLYGPGWAKTRTHNVKRASNNRTEDAKQLTLEEISKLVAGLRHVAESKKETA